MKLVLDIGNTRLKTSIYDEDGLRPVRDWQSHLEAADAVLVSNVAGSGALQAEVRGHPGRRVLPWHSAAAEGWLKGIPKGLGADRVAADIGARSLYSHNTLLIIDAGTCLTFDVIAADGRILGGAISPGVSLRLRAMHEYTSALPLLEPDGDHPILGYNTPTSMRSGAVNGMRWEIEGYIRHIRSMYPDLQVFFTGGGSIGYQTGSADFPPDLQPIITCDSLLVQKGLLVAFRDKD